MPSWPATGLGFSSPDTNILRSPDSALSVSSTSSDTKGMSLACSSGVATEGLHMVAARDSSIREHSAPSRGGRSTTPALSIEDAQLRDRSPRRIDPIEDGPSRVSSFGPLRGGARRGRSPFPIADHRKRDSRESSRPRMLADANIGDVDSFDDSLESNLGDQFDFDAMADDDNNGPGAPTGTDSLSLPSGTAQSYGPGATNVAAAQYNSDFSVSHQTVASSDQRSVTINQGMTFQEAGALVEHQVGQTKALADAAFHNLRAESSLALSASAQETRAA